VIAQSDTTQWPEAAIVIAGILLVVAIAVPLIWQVAATVRARATVQREEAYRKLAEESVDAHRRAARARGRLAERHRVPHRRARAPHQDGRVADVEKSTNRLLYSLRGSVP
jgi:hypothetical protein